MDRFSWAVAVVALLLFVGIVVGASVMTDPEPVPVGPCAGENACSTPSRPSSGPQPSMAPPRQ